MKYYPIIKDNILEIHIMAWENVPNIVDEKQAIELKPVTILQIVSIKSQEEICPNIA